MKELNNANLVNATFRVLASTDPSFSENLSVTDVVEYLILLNDFFRLVRTQVFDKRDFEWSLCNLSMLDDAIIIFCIACDIINSSTAKDYEAYQMLMKSRTGFSIMKIFEKLDEIIYLSQMKLGNELRYLKLLDSHLKSYYMSEGRTARTHKFEKYFQKCDNSVQQYEVVTLKKPEYSKITLVTRLISKGNQFQSLEEVIVGAGSSECIWCGDKLTPTTHFIIRDGCPHLQCIDCLLERYLKT